MTTTRVPNGISTASPNGLLGDFILPSPLAVHMFMEDFDYFDSNDWSISTVSGTVNLINFDGGAINLTNASGDNNSIFLQKIQSFSITSGKQFWFESKLQVNNSLQSDFLVGLHVFDSSPLDTEFGIFFRKDDDDTTIDFVITDNFTETVTPAIATSISSVAMRLGFFYDGIETIKLFVDGEFVGNANITTIPSSIMTQGFGIQNGSVSVTNLTVDYVFVAKER